MIWIFVIENIPKYKLFIKNEIKKWKLNWFKNTFDIITIKLISFLFEFLESKIYRIIRIEKNKKKISELRATHTLTYPTRTYCTIQYSVLCNTSVQNILQYRYMQISLGILSTPQYQFRSTFFFIQFSRSFWFRGVNGSFPDSKINCVDTRIAFVTSNCRPIRHCILITRYYTSDWTNTVRYIYIFEGGGRLVTRLLVHEFELTCIDFV